MSQKLFSLDRAGQTIAKDKQGKSVNTSDIPMFSLDRAGETIAKDKHGKSVSFSVSNNSEDMSDSPMVILGDNGDTEKKDELLPIIPPKKGKKRKMDADPSFISFVTMRQI